MPATTNLSSLKDTLVYTSASGEQDTDTEPLGMVFLLSEAEMNKPMQSLHGPVVAPRYHC